MKSILLTLDYELYGNGSGDVFKHIIEPTEKILHIADQHKAKITIFFEVIEYWKLKEEWDKGNKMGYGNNPIEAIERQLRDAYSKGHDIQLHLHPQWIDAVWNCDHWDVNLKKWRLGGYNETGEWSLQNIFQKGKETIEDIIRPIDEKYKCLALRAGGYNIQPSEEIVKAMSQTGLIADSSIYPGGKEQGVLSRYDYSSIPKDKGYWYCSDRLEDISLTNTGIIELPIVAFPIVRLYKYLSFDRIKSLLQNKNSAKEAFVSKTGGKKSGIAEKIKYFFQTEWQTWDYCLFSKTMHRKFLMEAKKQKDRDVFVLVGHPKSFVSGNGLEFLLQKISGDFQSLNMADFILKADR